MKRPCPHGLPIGARSGQFSQAEGVKGREVGGGTAGGGEGSPVDGRCAEVRLGTQALKEGGHCRPRCKGTLNWVKECSGRRKRIPAEGRDSAKGGMRLRSVQETARNSGM